MKVNSNLIDAINILSSSTNVLNEMIQEATPEIDKLFAEIIDDLVLILNQIKEFSQEAFIREKYLICEKVKEKYPTYESIPESIKQRVIENKDEEHLCYFTLEPCICGKSIKNTEDKVKGLFSHIKTNNESAIKFGEEFFSELENIYKMMKDINKEILKIVKISQKVDLISINAFIESQKMGTASKNFELISQNIKEASNNIRELGQTISVNMRDIEASLSKLIEKVQKFFFNFKQEFMEKQEKHLKEVEKNVLTFTSDFIEYIKFTSDFSSKLIDNISDIKRKITQKLQFIDIDNQRMQNIAKKFNVTLKMIDTIIDFIYEEIDEETLSNNIKQLEEEFKSIATVFREAEITSKNMNYDLSKHTQQVGEKMEDASTDIELF